LNKALADEWLAYYQYWVGSKVIAGPMKGEVETELIEHANDELRHADMLAERIIQLDGTPVLNPKEWYEKTNCGYAPPKDPYVMEIINQNIDAERCAIDVYNDMMKITRETDPITYQMAYEILKDELDHEQDLEDLKDDIEKIKRSVK
jgi:bacterioferritin